MEPVTADTYKTNFSAWKAEIESLKLKKERLRDDYLLKMRSLKSHLPVNLGEPVATQEVVDAAWALFNANQTEINTLYPVVPPGRGGVINKLSL